MKKIKQVMLFTAILLLLVGVACASEVSEDLSDTNSITNEAAVQDTHKVSDTANNIKDIKADKNIPTGKSLNNKLNENTTKTINKNTKSDVKTAPSITTWGELKSALHDASGSEVTLTLKKGIYKNYDSAIRWGKVNTKLIIDGNGQTIDANKKQVFNFLSGTRVVLKNITIKNYQSSDGGAIINNGTLTIINSTFTNNTGVARTKSGAILNNGTLNIIQSNFTDNRGFSGAAIKNDIRGKMNITQCIFTNNMVSGILGADEGGAIENVGTMTITNSTLANNKANFGGAIHNTGYLTITDSILANNSAQYGGAIRQQIDRYVGTHIDFTCNTFINNTATINKETIDLGNTTKNRADSNVYESTDIAIYGSRLNIKDNQKFFHTSEDVVLNFNVGILQHPNYYDPYLIERLDITVYINGVENVTTNSENYTLSNLKPGNYTVYYKIGSQKSNYVNFIVSSISNWQELQEAVLDATSQTENTTLFLMEGNYTNTGTINWNNPDITLTIEGNGHTIDGNQRQVFNINSRSSMVLKNIKIINAKSKYGGAINNDGILTILKSTLTNNSAEYGGAIENYGQLTVIKSTLTNNTVKYDGGAIDSYNDLNITDTILADNTASQYGGAVKNYQGILSIFGSEFTNNHAKSGGAILSYENTKLTSNTFINNTAENRETIDLYNSNGRADSNVYTSTDILLKTLKLSIKDNQKRFTPYEKVVLNFTIGLRNPRYYDSDILERLKDIKVYINGVEYATTGYENYTLTNLGPGDYTVYITTCNQKSKNITFKVSDESQINVTTWDVEMVRGRGVTFSAIVECENRTINQGQVYFEIDGKPLLDRNGSIIYVPVKDNWADLPYEMRTYISLGKHILTAVYMLDNDTIITDNKTLTIIENIPEGAGDEGKTPSSEHRNQQRYTKDTTHTITKYTKSIHPTLFTGYKVITDNNAISIGNTITLGNLNEIFGQTFTNGHLLLYIDGELVFNGTVNDDLSTVILEIMKKFLIRHEFKVEFTGADGQTNTYTKNVTIT